MKGVWTFHFSSEKLLQFRTDAFLCKLLCIYKSILSDRGQITTKRDECEMDYSVKNMCLRKKKDSKEGVSERFVVVWQSFCISREH